MIRKAVIKDIRQIHGLLLEFGGRGLLLPRSLSELYEHMRDYYVIEDKSNRGYIAGLCALGLCWDDLAEIRSLAVREEFRGKNLGSRLVETCVEEAKALGLGKVFALTYVPEFFNKLGFHEVDKSALPQKVWSDCLKCPKFPDCDEIALIREL
jgi:amino-acid N-acetyltransferase